MKKTIRQFLLLGFCAAIMGLLMACASVNDGQIPEQENFSGLISYNERESAFQIKFNYGETTIVGSLTKPMFSLFGTFNAELTIAGNKLTGTVVYDIDRENFDLKLGDSVIKGYVRHDNGGDFVDLQIGSSTIKGTIRTVGDRVFDLTLPSLAVTGREKSTAQIDFLDLTWGEKSIKGTKRVRASEFEYHLQADNLELNELLPFVLLELDGLMFKIKQAAKNPYAK